MLADRSKEGSVELHGSIESLVDEWDDLADRVRTSPFLRPHWFSLWIRAFGGRTLVLTLHQDGRLVAVLPLRRLRGGLASMTNDHTPEFGLLSENEEAAYALAQGLFSLRPRYLSLKYLNDSGLSMRSLRKAAAEARYRVIVWDSERQPYVVVDGDWDRYERSLKGKMRRDLGRRRRQLQEQGALSLDVQDGRQRLTALLEEGFGLEPSGWKEASRTAIRSRPETHRFYSDLAEWSAERGILRLSFLRLDGRPLAFQYGLEDGGTYSFIKGGYDPAYARFAPARLLIYGLLERAFSIGLRRYDFLGAPEAFKLEWTERLRNLRRLEAFAPVATASAAWAAVAYGRPVARRVRSLARRLP
jgi:CelD/BcsL family acetyltransferase involved in cellulose biosynthesis